MFILTILQTNYVQLHIIIPYMYPVAFMRVSIMPSAELLNKIITHLKHLIQPRMNF